MARSMTRATDIVEAKMHLAKVSLTFAKIFMAIFAILLAVEKDAGVNAVVGAFLELYVDGIDKHPEYRAYARYEECFLT